jgi:Kef-type K+ transport system membrane component KefB/voltage-gated potassium channel Kch
VTTQLHIFSPDSFLDAATSFLQASATMLPPFVDLLEPVSTTTHSVIHTISQGLATASDVVLSPDTAVIHDNNVHDVVTKDALESLGQDILIFLAATVAVVPLAKYFRVTPVLGFIAAGYFMGPYCLDAFANKEAAFELGDIGILFLLFSEGLNLSPERLKRLGAFGTLGVAQILVSMSIFFFGLLLLEPIILQYVAPILQMDDYIEQIFESPTLAFCIASAGALSSSAFVLPVLAEKGWKEKTEGIAAFSVLLLQDLAVAPLLVLLPLVAGSGPQSGTELGILAAKATIGFGAVLYIGSVLLRYVFDAVAAARSTETFVAAALLVALGMGQAADFLGLSATTGAFAAGVLLANNRYRAQIKADVRPFEGILLGIFFMTAGASVDPAVVLEDLPTLIIGITMFIAAKAIVLYGASLPLGRTRAQAARVAITLSGGGEFSLVLFNLARDLGVLPTELYKFLVATVIISMALTPFLGEIAQITGEYLDRLDQSSEGADGGVPLAEAMELFSRIDTDDSGTIDFEELRSALVERGLSYISIAEFFVAFDTNGDGTISKEEWLAGLEKGLLASALTVPSGEGETVGPAADIAPDAIVICGYTEFGRKMFAVLKASGATKNGGVVAFDLNPSRVAAGLLSGDNVVFGDAASPDLLRAAGIKSPKGVVIAFRSEAKRLEATERLREWLPPGTPIYARAVSGQLLGKTELLEAGATDVVSERTESALRFAVLLGAIREKDVARLRPLISSQRDLLSSMTLEATIPGLPDDRLNDLTEEFNCSRKSLINLYDVFTSLPEVNGEQFIEVKKLGDVMLRLSRDGPVNDDELAKWMDLADSERGGKISFIDFARVYYKSIQIPTEPS